MQYFIYSVIIEQNELRSFYFKDEEIHYENINATLHSENINDSMDKLTTHTDKY